MTPCKKRLAEAGEGIRVWEPSHDKTNSTLPQFLVQQSCSARTKINNFYFIVPIKEESSSLRPWGSQPGENFSRTRVQNPKSGNLNKLASFLTTTIFYCRIEIDCFFKNFSRNRDFFSIEILASKIQTSDSGGKKWLEKRVIDIKSMLAFSDYQYFKTKNKFPAFRDHFFAAKGLFIEAPVERTKLVVTGRKTWVSWWILGLSEN